MNTASSSLVVTILDLERAALDRWGRGDPSGFLEICAPEVSYFDPFLAQRIEGLPALSTYYESLRGQVKIDRDELLAPLVQVAGEAAVLSFNYVAYTGVKCLRWHCTEVYRQIGEAWRIVHTHWSLLAEVPGS
ncbi:MAG: nuclear transport factor 2 family protein [Betaproteobacteria bacterium]|nr:nuclear transport factor 2 family protein [Betaproteobacteria bacterium]